MKKCYIWQVHARHLDSFRPIRHFERIKKREIIKQCRVLLRWEKHFKLEGYKNETVFANLLSALEGMIVA